MIARSRASLLAAIRSPLGRTGEQAGPGSGTPLSTLPPPQFFVVGTQKGGTTSLYEYLKPHPRIVLSDVKEHHFFDQHYDEGLAWYQAQFPVLDASAGEITGDFTPLYMFHPHAIERMVRHHPQARIIVLLRNPVDRAFSHYNHAVRLGNEHRSFTVAIAEEPAMIERELARMAADHSYFGLEYQRHSYLSRGLYADQLLRLFQHYPRRQVLVAQSERLFQDPVAVLERIHEFLGLESHRPDAFSVHNQNRYAGMDPALRDRLRAYFEEPNRQLFELLGERFDWD